MLKIRITHFNFLFFFTALKWQTRVGTGIFFSSPRLSKDGVLFIGTTDGYLAALDTHSAGEVMWKLKTDGPFVGTALIAPGFA